MAEFCRQCNWELWGEEPSDLDHFGQGKPPLEEGYGYPAICEGCGFILVNDTGSCITKNCLKKGHLAYARAHPVPPLPSQPSLKPDP